ncbi:hypothetical protein ABB37_07292 [Leptomonas pyrrhocoris]|uniref:Myotubularin-related 12-like C-terminal domain-containing protein n=1 Tax=Leptomonas pyrrhocoris TaxID=157538 RepID=A0A0M9FVG7_LEPPY|nr:hypothetical protein ABB37_07292 [Leptomonas pyrrhocoris]XP_015655344.1 hypothetical protein ABB37_07292 [Leptomonas pyrrhocoris]KPA76904.1 hypothetical protein ABB37_07292 [Leptomonas pyrrhocoris]KPA76905.1 hypothetical protein ABB37_07292 [Leptomonas pyrrhocoris]|eukprot:XP_015655343.1 hypothetical protein ABB37_07292 [Leptomonas pyrrhocoris]
MTSVVHDLCQYRYVTSVHRPLPWAHVRHVCIPELRHESPDLPLMANLIAGLADCDVSLTEIREHNDADLLQLVEVLQACLQFALWSQNILKEKLLELQSSQVAKRVSARQLDHFESRCRALEREVQTLVGERDTLSLGTANLRTALVQLETTVKMQERQLKQERERTSLLVEKMEKAFAESAQLRCPAASSMPPNAVQRPQDAREALRCPTHRHRRRRSGAHSIPGGVRPGRQKASSTLAESDTVSDTATSLTDDSTMNAEAEFVWEEARRGDRRRRAHPYSDGRGAEGIFPSPCVDWRTLVRYIIHEEKHTPVWPAAPAATQMPVSAIASPSGPAPVAATAAAAPSPPALPAPSDSGLRHDFCDPLQALFSGFTAAVAGEVGEYARGTAAQTRDFVAATTQQRIQELTAAQQRFVKDVRDVLRSVPLAPPPAAASPSPPSPAMSPPLSAPSIANVEAKREDVSRNTQPQSEHPATPPSPTSPPHLTSSSPLKFADLTDATKKLKGPALAAGSLPQTAVPAAASSPRDAGYSFGSLFRSRDDSSPVVSVYRGSQPPSLFNSPQPEARSETGSPQQHRSTSGAVRSSNGNSRVSLLPTFSSDILRTPNASEHGASTASSTSSTPAKASARTGVVPPKDAELHSEVDDDGQPPDADLHPPTSSSSISPPDSYRSSSDDSVRHNGGSGDGQPTAIFTAAAAAAPTSISKVNSSFHAPPYAKPITTPPVYPALTAPQSSSPPTASPLPGGLSPHRTLSLHSSMRSDASGGSTRASSLMLRNTQRELEALLAEDAAAERAKARN